MNKSIPYFVILIFLRTVSLAQIPTPALIGYWHNWNDAAAPYLPLDQIDSRYQIVDVSFAVPQIGTDYQMEFIPDQVSVPTFINQVQSLQNQGKKVIISIGGATAPIALDNISERDIFISTMNGILNTYDFDGIDIDFEGASVSVTGGTISTPTDAKIVNLIEAIKQIMSNYYTTHNKKLLLTMAPETAFVQGGMSAYGGIWGAYLPLIHALRDSLDILHVQLYNSGSMFGIDGNVYTSGNADFIVAMTEAVIQGFNTGGGFFSGLPSHKIAVGLPACSSAAGSGYVDTATVRSAIDYLIGAGPQPGSYTLYQPGGYSDLRGLMTWSINWDAVSTCATTYQYAENFENIFGIATGIVSSLEGSSTLEIFPNPTQGTINLIASNSMDKQESISIYNAVGDVLLTQTIRDKNIALNISSFAKGMYFLKYKNQFQKIIKY